MNKILMVLAAFLCMTVTGFAQDDNNNIDNREKMGLGIKAGANYSNVYDSQGEEFKADGKLGLVFGLSLAVPIGKFIGIQPELLFSQKGFQGSGRILGGNYEFSRTTNFIDIPLMFALKPDKNFTILAGPQFSFLLKQSDSYTNGVTTVEQQQVFENDNVRNNIFCFIGGFDFNFNNYALGLRVGWDISDNHGDGTSSTPRYKNAWYQFTLGYTFFSE